MNHYDITNRYDEQDGDWDDIVSPDDYEMILEMKRFNRSQGYPAWTRSRTTDYWIMTRYWTPKMNEATARRINKMTDEGKEVNTSTHEGRKLIGYNYLELVEQN